MCSRPRRPPLNNLNTVTVVMWASVTTLVPAAQRNFGKALGNNNWAGYLNAAGVQAAYGRVSGTGALAAVRRVISRRWRPMFPCSGVPE